MEVSSDVDVKESIDDTPVYQTLRVSVLDDSDATKVPSKDGTTEDSPIVMFRMLSDEAATRALRI